MSITYSKTAKSFASELQAIVSEEDGMESLAHRFLSAAVKVHYAVIYYFTYMIQKCIGNMGNGDMLTGISFTVGQKTFQVYSIRG